MTSSPTQTATLASAEQEATCPVCPHPTEDHDSIGTRFCTATEAGGINRGCVCGGAQAPTLKSSATKEKGLAS